MCRENMKENCGKKNDYAHKRLQKHTFTQQKQFFFEGNKKKVELFIWIHQSFLSLLDILSLILVHLISHLIQRSDICIIHIFGSLIALQFQSFLSCFNDNISGRAHFFQLKFYASRFIFQRFCIAFGACKISL